MLFADGAAVELPACTLSCANAAALGGVYVKQGERQRARDNENRHAAQAKHRCHFFFPPLHSEHDPDNAVRRAL